MAIFTAAVILAIVALVRHPDTEAASTAGPPIPHLQEVRSIALDGEALPLSQLREVLTSRTGTQLDTAQLGRDRDAMERALAAMGYLAARVSPATVTFDATGAAYVIFEVDTGKLFHLRNVEVTGPGKDAAVVTITPGDEAIQGRIDQARQSLAEGLARRGKPSSVELSVHTDLGAAAVDVTLATR